MSSNNSVASSGKKGIKRTITRIFDDSDAGNLDDPDFIVKFDLKTLRKYELQLGDSIQITTMSAVANAENAANKHKQRSTFCKIDMAISMQSEIGNEQPFYLSQLAAQQLQVKSGDSVALHVYDTCPWNAVPIADVAYFSLVPDQQQQKTHLKYDDVLVKQAIANLSLPGRIRQCHMHAQLQIYVCEKCITLQCSSVSIGNLHLTSKGKLQAFRIVGGETSVYLNNNNEDLQEEVKQQQSQENLKNMAIKKSSEQAAQWIERVKQNISGYDSLITEFIQTITYSQAAHALQVASSSPHDLLKQADSTRSDLMALLYSKIHGIIVTGENGTGKTRLVQEICKQANCNTAQQWYCQTVVASDIFRDEIGASEKQVKELFFNAIQKCTTSKSSAIIVIDELESLFINRQDSSARIEKQVITELIHMFDYIATIHGVYICLIGIVNRLEQVDAALRRVNRFEKHIHLHVPNPVSRMQILQSLTKDMDVAKHVIEYATLNSHGFVPADLQKLITEASLLAIKNERYIPNEQDFEHAFTMVKPSLLNNQHIVSKFNINANHNSIATSKQAKVASSPVNVTFKDLAGIDSIIEQLKVSILLPMIHPEKYQQLGISPPRGVLLYGPTGVGKTTLAQAIANEIKANFINIQCTDVLSKFVGESSRIIANIFEQARTSAPCILFFDQFEAIARARGMDMSDSHAADRMLSTLLVEMDGIVTTSGSSSNSNNNVIILAATNRIDMLDAAILRPGRIDQHIYMPTPALPARLEILKLKTQVMPLHANVNLKELAKRTKRMSPSDLENLCREAAMLALREDLNQEFVTMQHFETALSKQQIKSLGEEY